MMRITVMALMTTLGAIPAAAQDFRSQSAGIRWEQDARQAITRSQQTRLPLMFWVLSSRDNRDRRLVSAQRAAFADPKVLSRAQYFVSARLSQSADRELIAELGLPPRINMEIAFVSPEGKLIDRLAAADVAEPATLAEKMLTVLKGIRDGLYEQEIKPVLSDPAAGPVQLRTALHRVRRFRITDADQAIVSLLGREGLDPAVIRQAYGVLATLSTPTAVDHLVKLSVAGDAEASTALRSVTPAGAELLLEHLVEEAGEVRLPIHDAIVASCRIANPRPARWWTNASAEQRQAETDRIAGLTRQAAARWRRIHAL